MFYIRASKTEVELEEQINDWEILFTADDFETADGFFQIQYQNLESDIWNWKHVEILDETGLQHAYYFKHEWLTNPEFFPLWPVPEMLKGLVPEKAQKTKEFSPPVQEVALCG